MLTREHIRDAASTMAWHWESNNGNDRLGVERLLLAQPVATRPVVAALVLFMLEQRGLYTAAAAWESLLFDLAGIEVDESDKRSPVDRAENVTLHDLLEGING